MDYRDPYKEKTYLVISDTLSSGSSMYQTRQTVKGKHIHDVLKALLENEHPRADGIFTLRIERLPETD